MATTSIYNVASEMGEPSARSTSGVESEPQLQHRLTTLNYAVRAYEESSYKSRTVTAVAFFVTTALAVAAEGSSPVFMLGFLCIALISAGTTGPMARHRFFSEIERAGRTEGLSTNNSERIASSMLSNFRMRKERHDATSA